MRQIHKVKEQVDRRKVLEGKGLGEQDKEDSDKLWIKQFRKKQAALRLKAENEEDNDDKSVDTANEAYTSKHLSGIKVAHNIEDLQEATGDTVLILKDKSVLDDDEDDENELISTALTAKERLEENKKARRGKQRFVDDADREEENKANYFVLDGSDILASTEPAKNLAEPVTKGKAAKTNSFSLEFDAIATKKMGDDYERPTVSFKKRKKPKKIKAAPAKRKWKDEDDDDNDTRMEDDDDLGSALLMHRRKAFKVQRDSAPPRRVTPEQLAEEVLQESETQAPEEEGGLVVSETTDFLSSIKLQSQTATTDKGNSHQEDFASGDVPDSPIQTEPMGEVSNGLQESCVTSDSEEASAAMSSVLDGNVGDDQSVSLSVADTLKLLRQRGVIQQTTAEDNVKLRKEQREWARQARKEQIGRDLEYLREKEELRNAGTYNTLSQREREELAAQRNRIREREEARAAEERFKDYKPEVKLEYRDERGNLLSTKEAFKHMSHQFHGNASGKRRVEKQLKKIEDEKKRMQESIFLAPKNATTKPKAPGAQIA
jgi:U4/U6.U5 tri-snRNP-associated protein 1